MEPTTSNVTLGLCVGAAPCLGNRSLYAICNILTTYYNICNITIYCSLKQILQYIWCVRGEYCNIYGVLRSEATIYCNIAQYGYNVLRHCSIHRHHVLTHTYTTIHVTSDLKLLLFTTSHLQTHSHIHLSIYAYSNASHIWSTTFIQPICAKINRAYRCVYIQPYTLHQI